MTLYTMNNVDLPRAIFGAVTTTGLAPVSYRRSRHNCDFKPAYLGNTESILVILVVFRV